MKLKWVACVAAAALGLNAVAADSNDKNRKVGQKATTQNKAPQKGADKGIILQNQGAQKGSENAIILQNQGANKAKAPNSTKGRAAPGG